MEIKQIKSLGMELTQFKYKSCIANVGVGEDWATIYSIGSEEQGKGHAQELISMMQAYFNQEGKEFGSSVALSPAMKHILKKFKIKEYQ